MKNTNFDMKFRGGGLNAVRLNFAGIFTRPFLFLVFLYFICLSLDVFNIQFFLFKAKATNILSPIIFVLALFLYKAMFFPRAFVLIACLTLLSMCISMMNSCNPIACLGFILFYVFNFVFYFVFSLNLFRWVDPDVLLRLYFASFVFIGFYALCQIVFSAAGVILPGVTQYIYTLARGQAFTYEPSFYALYMTPFAIFYTAKFMLLRPENRKIMEVVWPNLFLIVSTSTGCLFTYMIYILFFIFFFRFCAEPRVKVLIYSVLFRYSSSLFFVFSFIYFVAPDFVKAGYLKLFYFNSAGQISFRSRWEGIVNYWDFFLEHPWVGIGLGSGPFYLFEVSTAQNASSLDPDIYNHYAPMNVTIEVLSGLGILGGAIFLCFFVVLGLTFRKGLKIQALSEKERLNMIALALSLCVMFATLQFNQSIMRAYMWVHVGIFVGYIHYLCRSKSPLGKGLCQRAEKG